MKIAAGMETRLNPTVSAPAGYPHRVVARLVSDAIIDVVLRITYLHDFNIDKAFVFLSILQSNNRGDWTQDGDLSGKRSVVLRDECRRPVSMSALAEGLRLPRETTRRHVMSLIESGACAKRDRLGYVVPRAFESSGPMRAFYDHAYSSVLRLVEDCNALGFAVDPLPHPCAIKRRQDTALAGLELRYFVARKFIDYVLRISIDALPVNITLMRGLLFIAVMRENVRHITYDTRLAWRYSKEDEPPPDQLRRPVSIRSLSKSLHLPYTTISRHVRGMIDDGVFVSDEKGVIIPQSVMQKTEYLNNGTRLYYWFVQLIQDLRAGGFNCLARVETPDTI